MSILSQAIAAAIHILANSGECTEAELYPASMPAATIGYVTIGDCVLPEIAEMRQAQILDTYLEIVGD